MPSSILSSTPQGLSLAQSTDINRHNQNQQSSSLFGEDGFNFGDILDIINPLQHIPLVGTLYRKITGDTIAPIMKVAGGALFGGPIGAAASFVTSAIESGFNKEAEPEIDTLDAGTVVERQEQLRTIGSQDYISQKETPGPAKENPITQLNSISLKAHKPIQYSDGIINPAHSNPNLYQDIVSSNKKPGDKIDIVIGQNVNPG